MEVRRAAAVGRWLAAKLTKLIELLLLGLLLRVQVVMGGRGCGREMMVQRTRAGAQLMVCRCCAVLILVAEMVVMMGVQVRVAAGAAAEVLLLVMVVVLVVVVAVLVEVLHLLLGLLLVQVLVLLVILMSGGRGA